MASNKLVVFAVILAAMLVLTQATFKATTITTEVETDMNPRCDMGGSQWPNHCEKFMRQGSSSSSRRQRGRYPGQEGMFDMCCNELMNMDPECQCEAMKMMVMDMKHMSGGSMMMEKAMMMPAMCGTMDRKCSIMSI